MLFELVGLILAVTLLGVFCNVFLRVAKASLRTAIILALIVLTLQLVFDIKLSDLWKQITQIGQVLWQLLIVT